MSDAGRSTQLLASTTLRNVLGTKNLSEILSDRYFKKAQLVKCQMKFKFYVHFRENTAEVILRMLDEATDPWGIKVDFQF